MKSILTILSVACVFTLGACATKTATSSCCASGKEKCAPGPEQKCTDGSCDTTHKGHSHAKTKKM